MADPSKTEPATPKRKRAARSGGQLARSPVVNSIFVLLLEFMTLRAVAQVTLNNFETLTTHFLSHLNSSQWTPNLFMVNLRFMIIQFLTLIFPILLACAIGAFIAGVAQAGFQINIKPIMPNLTKLNPATGAKRIFSSRGFIELPRS